MHGITLLTAGTEKSSLNSVHVWSVAIPYLLVSTHRSLRSTRTVTRSQMLLTSETDFESSGHSK